MPDLFAEHFLAHGKHGIDLGNISAATAAVIGGGPGPVRLQHGYEGPKGFGNRHVEAYEDRMKQMLGLGYGTFLAFAADVAQNYEKIGDAKDGRRGLLRHVPGQILHLVVEYKSGSDPFWGVVTGWVARGIRCSPVVWEKARAGGSEPTPDTAKKHPRFETLSLSKKS